MKQMKQLKSSSQDLRDLFQNNILVRHVAEKLESCKADDDAVVVRGKMEERDFDVMGIKSEGSVYGYVERDSLKEGQCKQYAHIFLPSEFIVDSAPLLDLLPILRDNPRIFVTKRNQVTSIVTRGDLRKAPIRMLLFGLITLLEMQMLRAIRDKYHTDSWQSLITEDRLNKPRKLFAELKQKNETIGLADCLEFCDKRVIVLKTPEIWESLNLESKSKVKQLLEDAEELRNNLCHSQDIITGSSWSEILVLVEDIQKLLEKLETM